ncbi:toll/interleukin-1 receptor (TIR) domain-containing protein [Artemisia annua]|uniref:ADP-ribosyl cyclase/cyclic ADP-ribose hydrolase n=1 Tax=Artemisia annua TaxID=35608 RepID=A0A2U1L207_ARTAN|nr:toll/interleukin-1 receptor (TIR) domain-containing protein [Artemisia annua]
MGADLMFTLVVVILATIIILVMKMFKVVSIVPSPDDSGASPVPNTLSSSSGRSSWKYDVFLSFRGEDTRKTFVDHLYVALVERTICTYKDDITLARGDTIGESLLKAIEESHIALIVFSENYANSSWCLDELAYIMKCKDERGNIVIPIFYDVDPSDVRKLKGQFGKAFSKHNNKSTDNEKVQAWRTALVGASNIAGWETKFVANGHEAKCIKEIVGSVLDILLSFNPVFENEKLVGMGTRLQDLESQLEIGSGGARMVGIWGVGGGGKTTLATSLYKKISCNFDSCCFVENIREESSQLNGLKNLQKKILAKVLKTQVEVESVDLGQGIIKSRLCSRNVLIVLDDVDDVKQLEALAGSRKWFGDGSRIIITTRDKQVLISHGVDVVSSISLLSREEAIRLFRRYAYLEDNPVEDYDELSLLVISYVDGLPLALKIIGSFLKGKNKIEWNSALEKLKDIPNTKVMEILKISYDGLDFYERELFLDIACFFRGKSKEEAMEILKACAFHVDIGVKVLIEKSLITISSDDKIDMHDLIQEMGHHIVRGEHPNNPEKHSRVWRSEEISDMCSQNATKEDYEIEAIRYDDFHFPKQGFMTLVSKLKKLRFLDVTNSRGGSCFDEGPNFLSNELKYINWHWYPPSLFPKSFQPRKLVVLKLKDSLQKELWKGDKCMPCLKQLELTFSNSLVRTPDIGGLSCLEELIIKNCKRLKEIHQSLGNHESLVYVSISVCNKLTRFPSIVRMEKLKTLEISFCKALEFPKIEENMDSLEKLHLYDVAIEVLPSSIGIYCKKLISLKLEGCSKLKSIEGNFHALEHLQKFKLVGCTLLEYLPKDLFAEECCLEELCFDLRKSNTLPPFGPSQLPRLLRKLNLGGLKNGEVPREIGKLSNLRELHLCHNDFTRLDFSLISQLARLKLLNLSGCDNLVELPELPSSLSILEADDCGSLEAIRDDVHRNCKWLCQVSITKSYGEEGCWSLVGGDRLLESMLQGMGHRCMRLHLKGIEIPKGFEPRLVRGRSCRLKLPKNWFNEYAGFLFCCVYMDEESYGPIDSVKITMRRNGGMDSQQQAFWEEKENEHLLDIIQTWVGYVPFESLRHTAWWDQTSTTSVDVSIDFLRDFIAESPISISGFGVRLVSNKKDQMKETTTNFPSEFSDDDYKCIFNIRHDSSDENIKERRR